MRFIMLLVAMSVLTARADLAESCPVGANVRGHENTEWSIAYGYHLIDDQKSLPRVLLVGDSICCGYQKSVARQLEGKANISYWASSYCVTSPGYLKLLDFYLSEARYDVIHFNNGLHSLETSTADWARQFEAALRLIRKRQPQARIIWATSTPLRDGEAVEAKRVIELNIAGAAVVKRLGGIETNDLFTLLNPLDRKTNWLDMYHHCEAVREQTAAQVVKMVKP